MEKIESGMDRLERYLNRFDGIASAPSEKDPPA
jgi:hypothetical protein